MAEYYCETCDDYFTAEKKECPECGEVKSVNEVSPCCFVEIDEDLRICPNCKEHV